MKRQLVIFVVLAFIVGCGRIGMPPPTDKPVIGSDIHGTWEYSGMYHRGLAQITFHTNNTFTHVINFEDSGTIVTNHGQWALDGPTIDLTPFWTTYDGNPHAPEKYSSASWWVTSWYAAGLAPFGGDSPDPDQWSVFSRVE